MGSDSRRKNTGEAPVKGRAKPTLKTISDLSGLAVPTVSRALNDAPDIGAQTKKRVREIADQIGYVPNRAGVRLRTGRTNVISLVLSTQHDMMNHTARLIASLAGALRDTRYHMIITPYFPDEDPMKPIRYIVENGSADAVVFNQIEPQDPRIAYLMEKKFPFATHGRSDWRENHAYFDFDNSVFARLCVRELVRRGRKSIVLVAPPTTQNYAHDMIEGARDEAATLGVEFTILDRVTSDTPGPELIKFLHETAPNYCPNDGFVCGSTGAAMAVVAALEEQGRKIGQDFDVAGKEAIRFLHLFRPEIFALAEDVAHAGRFLAEAAIKAIHEPDAKPMQFLEIPEFGALAPAKE